MLNPYALVIVMFQRGKNHRPAGCGYTKVVLTVIAAALVWLALRPAVLPVPAEAGVVRVRIEAVSPSVTWPLPVRIEEVSSLTRPLPVKVVDR
jgi:hypothetical protein